MNKWLIKIIMADGSFGSHTGVYADGFAAIVCAMDFFPAAAAISARRLA